MRNILQPRTVSFEGALKNLAHRLTGVPVEALPNTQEGIVQYMAENLPDTAPSAGVDVDALAEAITTEVLAKLAASAAENGSATGDGSGQGTTDDQQATVGTPEGKTGSEGTLDIVDGHITAESLDDMTVANLSKLAEKLGADISKCKKKADFVAVLSQVVVQTDTTTITE